MAKDITPAKTSAELRAEQAARRQAAEEEAFKREVDDAVRQGELQNFGERYGKPLAIVGTLLVAGLAAFFLWWQPTQRAEREQRSETLVSALDQIQAGNLAAADERLVELSDDGSDAAAISARMLRAGIAAEQGDTDEALALFDAIAQDAEAPEALRTLATIRWAATGFDTLEKDAIIAALTPHAEPGQPFFGSAGELLAMAYLENGDERGAGRLFAQIAQGESVPESLRSRARQMAGVLGVDAVENIEALLEEQGVSATTDDADAIRTR